MLTENVYETRDFLEKSEETESLEREKGLKECKDAQSPPPTSLNRT